MNLSIRWKLILGFSIPLLLTYAGMLAWDYWRQRESAIQQAQDVALERAQSLAGALNARLEAVMQQTESTAAALGRQERIAEPQLRAVMGAGFRLNPTIQSTLVITTPPENGSAAAHGWTTRRGGIGQRAFEPLSSDAIEQFQSLLPFSADVRERWAGPHEPTAIASQPVCTYIVPISAGESQRGVVAANVAVGELLRGPRGGRFRRGGSPPTTRPDASEPLPDLSPDSVVILDQDARVIAPRPADRDVPSLLQFARQQGADELDTGFRAAQAGQAAIVRVEGLRQVLPSFSHDGAYWIALSPIASTGWVLSAAIPEAQVIDPIIQRLWQRGGFLALGMIALLAVVTLVSIRISRPIEQMAAAVRELAGGNLDARVQGVTNRDELGQLAGAFNSMTTQLKSHVAALTEQTAAREAVEAEMRLARQIQTDLLPRTFPPFPDRREFDLHAINVPAQRVAGDFYDFFFTRDDLLTVVIADVSGKGMPAALLMAVTRTILRNLAFAGLEPAVIAERANMMLLADTSDLMFVTMFLLQYHPDTGRLVYVNAGHPHPYRMGADRGLASFGQDSSALLGVCPTSEIGPFLQHEDQLRPGETLVLFTDGVTEARSPDGTMLRSHGVQRLLERLAGRSVEQVCAELVREVDRFQGSHPADDITVVALRRAR